MGKFYCAYEIGCVILLGLYDSDSYERLVWAITKIDKKNKTYELKCVDAKQNGKKLSVSIDVLDKKAPEPLFYLPINGTIEETDEVIRIIPDEEINPISKPNEKTKVMQ